MTGPVTSIGPDTLVLVVRDGVLRVARAPEQAWTDATVVDGPHGYTGVRTRNVAGNRYLIIDNPAGELTPPGTVVYLVGEQRPDGAYPLTRVA